MPLPIFNDPITLIAYLVSIGVTLTENDKARIRADLMAACGESDAATERSRALDAPRDGQ